MILVLIGGVLALSGAELVIGGVVGIITGGASVAGILDKQRRASSDAWRELAEAREAATTFAEEERQREASAQSKRIADLEARVDLMASHFVADLATKVATAVVPAVLEAMAEHQEAPR